jgi:DNA adenine methylase
MNKSFLKWAGGKSQSIEFIGQALPKKIKRLVEPFVGSAVVSLNVEAEEYLLADYNQDLINLFEAVKEHGQEFIEYCRNFFIGGNEKNVFYYNRQRFNSLSFNDERAALFLYLNRHAFNGLCRYNSSGGFNVPFGKYETIYFPEQEMAFFHERSEKFEFVCCSFEDVFNLQRKDDTYYCDPPYIPLNATASFTDYTDKGFPFELQQKLVELSEKSICKVLLSNHWVPGITDKLYKNGDSSRRKDVTRSISAKKSGRGKVEEVLVVYN